MQKMLVWLSLSSAIVLSPALAGTLTQTPKSLQSGLVKYSKKIPQCASVKSSVVQGVLQRLDYGVGKVEVNYKVSETGLESVTLNAPNSPKDNGQLQAMMCATAALMQSMQPDYETQESALSNAAHIWKSSAKAPFTMAFYFDQMTAQHVPFQLKAWNK